MIPVDFPYALTASRWEEQERQVQRAAPKLERTGLADALRRLRRAHDACDLDAFDDAEPEDAAAIGTRLSQAQSQGQAKVRALRSACDEVRGLAQSFERDAAGEAAVPRSAVQQAQTIQRLASALADRWGDALDESLQRLRGWQSARLAESGNLRILRRKLQEGLKTVKALAPRPGAPAAPAGQAPRRVSFLALTDGNAVKVIVGESITTNHRNMLSSLMGGGSLRPIRGTCIWENGFYTFVSDRANATLGKQLKKAIAEITHRQLPVKARRPAAGGTRQA